VSIVDGKDPLFETWLRVKKYQEDYNASFDIVKIATTGVQSAGKSTLIEAIVKSPLSYTARSTGTRCPTIYRLKHDPTATKPIVYMAGKHVNLETVPDKVEEHMQNVANKEPSGFTLVPLEIEISSEELTDMELIDLPGLLPAPSTDEEKEKAKAIKCIQAEYVRDPMVFLVAVVRGQDHEMSTNTDVGVLNDVAVELNLGRHPPRPDWKSNALIVVNKVDQYITGFQGWKSVADAEAFFQNTREWNHQVVYVHPKANFKVEPPQDNAKYQEKRDFLQHLQEYEQQWFKRVIQDLEAKGATKKMEHRE
jgi:ribosome biogenesis GTPase A